MQATKTGRYRYKLWHYKRPKGATLETHGPRRTRIKVEWSERAFLFNTGRCLLSGIEALCQTEEPVRIGEASREVCRSSTVPKGHTVTSRYQETEELHSEVLLHYNGKPIRRLKVLMYDGWVKERELIAWLYAKGTPIETDEDQLVFIEGAHASSSYAPQERLSTGFILCLLAAFLAFIAIFTVW